jgi:hypothetical protein
VVETGVDAVLIQSRKKAGRRLCKLISRSYPQDELINTQSQHQQTRQCISARWGRRALPKPQAELLVGHIAMAKEVP